MRFNIVFFIGAIITVFAVILLLNPRFAKIIINFVLEGPVLYIHATIRIIIGIIFLINARSCRIPWVIITIGTLILSAGFLLFIIKLERAKRALRWYRDKSENFMRLAACLVLLLGIIILYAA